MEQGARYLLSVLHLWEEEEISIKGSSIKEIIVAPCCYRRSTICANGDPVWCGSANPSPLVLGEGGGLYRPLFLCRCCLQTVRAIGVHAIETTH